MGGARGAFAGSATGGALGLHEGLTHCGAGPATGQTNVLKSRIPENASDLAGAKGAGEARSG